MGLLTINGSDIIEASIRMPRVGVWHADLRIDLAAGVTGSVTIASADGAFSIKGTVYRAGIFENTLSLRVLGGAAGLATVLPPKFYQGVPLSIPLKDALSGCGESLSGTSDSAVTGTSLKKWTRTSGTGKQAIQRLLEPLATSWRILPDGTFWVGTDTYPPAPSTPYDVLARNFGEGRVLIGSDQPFLYPGVALTISASATQGVQNISYVVHKIEPGSVRTEAWFERKDASS